MSVSTLSESQIAIFNLARGDYLLTTNGTAQHQLLLEKSEKKTDIHTVVDSITKVAEIVKNSCETLHVDLTKKVIKKLLNRLIHKRDAINLNQGCLAFIANFFKNRKIAGYNRLIAQLASAYSILTTSAPYVRDFHERRELRKKDPVEEEFYDRLKLDRNALHRSSVTLIQPLSNTTTLTPHEINKEEALLLIDTETNSIFNESEKELIANHLVEQKLKLVTHTTLIRSEQREFKKLVTQALIQAHPSFARIFNQIPQIPQILEENPDIEINFNDLILLSRGFGTLLDTALASIFLKKLQLETSEENIKKLVASGLKIVYFDSPRPLDRALVLKIISNPLLLETTPQKSQNSKLARFQKTIKTYLQSKKQTQPSSPEIYPLPPLYDPTQAPAIEETRASIRPLSKTTHSSPGEGNKKSKIKACFKRVAGSAEELFKKAQKVMASALAPPTV